MSGPIPGLDVHALHQQLDARPDLHLLDVGDEDEFASGHIAGAQHVYVGQIEQRLADIPKGPVVTYCASGRGALVAARGLGPSWSHRRVSVLGLDEGLEGRRLSGRRRGQRSIDLMGAGLS